MLGALRWSIDKRTPLQDVDAVLLSLRHRRLLEPRGEKRIPPFTPKPDTEWAIGQEDVDRVAEFRKCIECFLCQDVCHILRDHQLHSSYFGPRFLVRIASLEMHPLDTLDRLDLTTDEGSLGLCNTTKCCTKVCPEGIHITDNAIIPLKERVVDRRYDPFVREARQQDGQA